MKPFVVFVPGDEFTPDQIALLRGAGMTTLGRGKPKSPPGQWTADPSFDPDKPGEPTLAVGIWAEDTREASRRVAEVLGLDEPTDGFTVRQRPT